MTGLTAYAKGTDTEFDTFLKLIYLTMIDENINCSNKYTRSRS